MSRVNWVTYYAAVWLCRTVDRNVFIIVGQDVINYVNLHPLEVVFRYRGPQLQLGENDLVSLI